jgi:hypothetical protein
MTLRKNGEILLQRQCGTALLASLLLLLVITIVSVTAMKDTMMDESMARNDQNHTIAFQAADAAVNRTLNLLRKDEVLSEEARVAKESGNADPTRQFADIKLVASPKDVENNVVVAQTLYGNPRGSCANYDCPFNARRFNVTATANVVNTHAKATVLQNAQKEPYLRDPDRTFTTPVQQ